MLMGFAQSSQRGRSWFNHRKRLQTKQWLALITAVSTLNALRHLQQVHRISPIRVADTLSSARTPPFVVFPQYWQPQKVDRLLVEVQRGIGACHQIAEGALNYRRMGMDENKRDFPLAHELANDKYMSGIVKHYIGRRVNAKAQGGITLLHGDSGGGWHQDKISKGIKAMMYLTDVTDSSGPFQMLLHYNSTSLQPKFDRKGRKTRFSDESIAEQVENGAFIVPIVGKKGTLVIFEVSNVHRGAPASREARTSMTIYYDTDAESAHCSGSNVYSDVRLDIEDL